MQSYLKYRWNYSQKKNYSRKRGSYSRPQNNERIERHYRKFSSAPPPRSVRESHNPAAKASPTNPRTLGLRYRAGHGTNARPALGPKRNRPGALLHSGGGGVASFSVIFIN